MPRRKSIITKIHELKAEPGKRALLPVPGATGLYIRATDRNGKAFTVIGRRKIDGKRISAKVPADDIGIDTETTWPKESLDRRTILLGTI